MIDNYHKQAKLVVKFSQGLEADTRMNTCRMFQTIEIMAKKFGKNTRNRLIKIERNNWKKTSKKEENNGKDISKT